MEIDLNINEQARQALLMERSKGGVLGGPEIETKKPVRYILNGNDLPKISDHIEKLEDGITIGQVIVNKVTPQILRDDEQFNRFVKPFINPKAEKYIKKYISFHGIQSQECVINRTDMLLTASGLMANEINPDAPEGFGLTRAG